MDPKQQALARREMNQWLADNGINGRTVTLIDAMISIWIGLENPDNERRKVL